MIPPPSVLSRLTAAATGKAAAVSEVLPDGTISKYVASIGWLTVYVHI